MYRIIAKAPNEKPVTLGRFKTRTAARQEMKAIQDRYLNFHGVLASKVTKDKLTTVEVKYPTNMVRTRTNVWIDKMHGSRARDKRRAERRKAQQSVSV